MRAKIVAVEDIEKGTVTLHASAQMPGSYETLCCISLTDDLFRGVEAPPRAKIKCVFCWEVWSEAKRFRATDFNL